MTATTRFLLLCLLALPGFAPAAQKPNILFILADDIGYGDLGCYGATKIKTPNCDRLASEGLRFTDAHSPSAVCTPTRYAFMTGQYAWRKQGQAVLKEIETADPGTARQGKCGADAR